jgi:hypothetical protein
VFYGIVTVGPPCRDWSAYIRLGIWVALNGITSRSEESTESAILDSNQGTKRVSRVEENTAADGIGLDAEQVQRLNDLAPAAGERHEEAQMSVIDR